MNKVKFRATGLWNDSRVVIVYGERDMVGAPRDLRRELELGPSGIDDPIFVLQRLEVVMTPLEGVELLEGDFVESSQHEARPRSEFGVPVQLMTRWDAAHRAGMKYSDLLSWQEQGLLHPIELEYGGRPEVHYTLYELDQAIRATGGTPPKPRERPQPDAAAAALIEEVYPTLPDAVVAELQRLRQENAELRELVAGP